MKRIIAVFMAIALLLSVSIVVFAEDEVFEGGSYRYKIINDEEVSVVGFHGDGIDLHLDSSIGHRFITEVGPSAFEFNDNLVNVRLSSRGECASFQPCQGDRGLCLPRLHGASAYYHSGCSSVCRTVCLPELCGSGVYSPSRRYYRDSCRHLYVLPGAYFRLSSIHGGENRIQSV